jgi:hypothetical protein
LSYVHAANDSTTKLFLLSQPNSTSTGVGA